MTTPFDTEEQEETFNVEPDADVDVDASAVDGPEDTPEEAAKPPKNTKAATPKAPARPAVAEGYITPVNAAKALSEHLTAKARAAGQIGDDEKIEIRPQVVYATLKNNGDQSKNPIKQYTDPKITGGRNAVLKLEEFLAWWDAKDARVAERKNRVVKTEAPAAAEEPQGEAVEAE